MKRIATLILALCLILAACCARADLLTFWGIPEETARAARVLTPHAVDGTLTWAGRADENGALPHGWLAVVDEVCYDGVTAYVYYTIREVNGEKAIGTRDEDTGLILLTDEDEHYIANRGVGWNQDNLLVNGRKIDMPLTGMDSRGSTLPGLTNHYMEIDLLSAGFAPGEAKTLGLPIGDPWHVAGRELTDEELRACAETGQYPEEMGFIVVDLGEAQVERRAFTPQKTIGDTTVSTVETLVSPIRLYVSAKVAPDGEKAAAQHEKDKETFGSEDVPLDFSAGTVNDAWAFGAQLVDADGKAVKEMTGDGTGVRSAGADEVRFAFNLPVKDGKTSAPEGPLYLAMTDETGAADMSTAVQVY